MSAAPAVDRSAQGRANRTRGATRELFVRDYYREQGWWATKTSRSEGVDVIAAKSYEVEEAIGGCQVFTRRTMLLFIEVKSTRTPFSSFPPSERRAFLEAARLAGAEARLFHWPKGVAVQQARVYKPEEWPKA